MVTAASKIHHCQSVFVDDIAVSHSTHLIEYQSFHRVDQRTDRAIAIRHKTDTAGMTAAELMPSGAKAKPGGERPQAHPGVTVFSVITVIESADGFTEKDSVAGAVGT